MSTETNTPAEFDYVVVGSGAGGGPLACNLAKAGYKVLLLEAGGEDENYNYQVPCFHGAATEDEALKWDYFVRHYADDAQQRLDSKFVEELDGVPRNGILYPRAGTLGGCTAHNAMITVYPHNSDWDYIAELTGDSSWNSDNMRSYFERLERCTYIDPPGTHPKTPVLRFIFQTLRALRIIPLDPSRHGFTGWLTTSEANPKLVLKDFKLLEIISEAAIRGLKEHVGDPLARLKVRLDPNDWRVVKKNYQGIAFTPLAVKQGQRNGTREYIKAVRQEYPDRLEVRTHALTTRVLLDDEMRAIGVEYLQGEHLYQADPRAGRTDGQAAEKREVFVKREVILAAGAFNTPQLLKLSGIGPKEELEKHGISVRVDLPGVGQNLQDRYEVGVITEMEANFSLLKDATFKAPAEGQTGDPCFVEWQQQKTGVYTTNGAVIGIIKRSDKDRPLPDLYIFGLPGYFKGYEPGYSKALQQYKNVFTWAILKAHTNNTAGEVTLRSSDPRETPLINFHYFSEGNDAKEEDLEAVADGVEFVRRMNSHIGNIAKQELLPGPQVRTRDEIKTFIRNEAWGHHASCTCKIGRKDDALAVLDGDFRVYGTKNLRVVDASVFPRIPGFFIVSAIYMISEKASDVIIADAQKTG